MTSPVSGGTGGPLGAAFVSGLGAKQMLVFETLADDYMIEVLTQVTNFYVNRLLEAALVPAALTAAAGDAIDPALFAGVPRSVSESLAANMTPLVAEVYQSSQGAVRADMIRELGVTIPPVRSLDSAAYLRRAPKVFDDIGDQLQANMRTALADGFDAGESIEQIAARVRGAAGTTSRKATLIARTSVIAAANNGSIDMAKASGIEMQKEWLATVPTDGRTRPTHVAADGQRVPLHGKFTVGGFECDHPGEYTLPDSEKLGCRCTQGYVIPRTEVGPVGRTRSTVTGVDPDRFRVPDLPSPGGTVDLPALARGLSATDQFGFVFEDPANLLPRATLMKLAKDAGLPVGAKTTRPEIVAEIRFWESATGNKVLPEVDVDVAPVANLLPEPDPGELVGGLYQLKTDTGPGGIAVRAVTDVDGPFEGRAWRINDTNYVIGLPKRPLTPREQSIVMRILADLQRIHAETPGASDYTRSYIFALHRNPADAYWAKQYNMPGFKSGATAGRGAVTFWDMKGFGKADSSGVPGDTIAHETGHNLDNLKAKKEGLGSDSQEWADAVAADASVPKPAGIFDRNIKPPTDPAKGQPDGATKYGQSSPSEDFAESYMMYLQGRLGRAPDGTDIEFRDIFPNRAAIFDRLLPDYGAADRAALAALRARDAATELPDLPSPAKAASADPAMKLTVTQLRALADANGITGVKALKKPDMVAALRKWEADNGRTLLPPRDGTPAVPTPPTDAPAVPETVGVSYAQRQTALRDLVGQRPVDTETLQQGLIAETRVLVYADGRRAVRKVHHREEAGLTPVELTDAEELSAHVAAAVGARAPAVIRTGENAILEEFVDGVTGSKSRAINDVRFRRQLAQSDEGQLIGLTDTLIANEDRGPSNWMLDNDENIWAIDHGSAFADVADRDPLIGPTAGEFNDQFVNAWDSRISASNDMSPADMGIIVSRLQALRPEFERLGRLDWYDGMMARAKAIKARAQGTRSRLAVVPDRKALRGEARARQADIDAADSATAVLSDVDELVARRADVGVIEARLQEGIAGKALTKVEADVVRKAVATGDAAKIQAALAKVGKKRGVAYQHSAGDLTTMTDAMRSVSGRSIAPGAQVRVVRRGATLTRNGETITLDQTIVREVTPGELAAIRQTVIDERTKMAAAVAQLRAELDKGPVSGARVGQIADRNNLPIPARQVLVKASATPDGLKRALAAQMKVAEVKASGVVNRGVDFDPDTMETRGGGTLEPGTKVKVVETGYVTDIDGRTVVLRKTLVEPVAPKTPAKAATVTRGKMTPQEISVDKAKQHVADLDALVVEQAERGASAKATTARVRTHMKAIDLQAIDADGNDLINTSPAQAVRYEWRRGDGRVIRLDQPAPSDLTPIQLQEFDEASRLARMALAAEDAQLSGADVVAAVRAARTAERTADVDTLAPGLDEWIDRLVSAIPAKAPRGARAALKAELQRQAQLVPKGVRDFQGVRIATKAEWDEISRTEGPDAAWAAYVTGGRYPGQILLRPDWGDPAKRAAIEATVRQSLNSGDGIAWSFPHYDVSKKLDVISAILRHEFGHYVSKRWTLAVKGERWTPGQRKRLLVPLAEELGVPPMPEGGDFIDWFNRTDVQRAIRAKVSAYAAQGPDELLAEIWAVYSGRGLEASKIAKRIGKIMADEWPDLDVTDVVRAVDAAADAARALLATTHRPTAAQLKKLGMSKIATPSKTKTVPYDPDAYDLDVGVPPPAAGAPVRIVEPGYSVTVDGETVIVRKPVVEVIRLDLPSPQRPSMVPTPAWEPGNWSPSSLDEIRAVIAEEARISFRKADTDFDIPPQPDAYYEQHGRKMAQVVMPDGATVDVNGNLNLVSRRPDLMPENLPITLQRQLDALMEANPVEGRFTVTLHGVEDDAGSAFASIDGISLYGNYGMGEMLLRSWYMQMSRETIKWVYTLTHEFGHSIMFQRGHGALAQRLFNELGIAGDDAGAAAFGTTGLRRGLMSMSYYGQEDYKEAYAEAFAEWFLSGGSTENPVAIRYAEVFGWTPALL